MCQEIQYHGMMKPECAKARASPKLEHQNTCQQLIAIFAHKHKHQKGQLLLETKNKIKWHKINKQKENASKVKCGK